jgi:paraquat-inducible protein B
MAKQIHKTVIGGFVVSVIVMLIVGVIILGGGKMFKKTWTYVLFFEKSVKGLSVGAPVVFNGVKIGSVSNVIINVDLDKVEFSIPVIIEIDPSLMTLKGNIA